MKLKAITLALFLAGIASSYALADDGGGKGKKEAAAATTTAATTTSEAKGKGKAKDAQDKHAQKKVTLCHKAGKSGKYVKISVSKNAVKAHKRHGDVEATAGTCASQAPTTTSVTTTTTATTTAATTTTTP